MTSFNKQDLFWIRKPDDFSIAEDEISITTAPHTDLWQRTFYHFRNDNAPLLLFKTSQQYFSFSFKTDFSGAHTRFDQSGLALYQDSENWLKASVEYENQEFSHLGAVVTNHGFSDWSTQEVRAQTEVYLRLSRRGADYKVEYSNDAQVWHQMRVAHLHEGAGEVAVGIYACSPEESSFTAKFSKFCFGECQWAAHDGQQPDEDE